MAGRPEQAGCEQLDEFLAGPAEGLRRTAFAPFFVIASAAKRSRAVVHDALDCFAALVMTRVVRDQADLPCNFFTSCYYEIASRRLRQIWLLLCQRLFHPMMHGFSPVFAGLPMLLSLK
jgi:hypothetical protein